MAPLRELISCFIVGNINLADNGTVITGRLKRISRMISKNQATIAILGGTGEVSRPLVQQALAAGYSVRLRPPWRGPVELSYAKGSVQEAARELGIDSSRFTKWR